MSVVNLTIVDIHARKAEKKSTLVEGARPVLVNHWEIIAIAQGTDTNYQLTIGTTDPNEARKYKVGGSVDVKFYPKGTGLPVEAEVVQLTLAEPYSGAELTDD